MIVRYKKNGKSSCYDTGDLMTVEKKTAVKRFCGPFKSCGECPYPSHGFICFRAEGNCLRTDVEKMKQRKNKPVKEKQPDVM